MEVGLCSARNVILPGLLVLAVWKLSALVLFFREVVQDLFFEAIVEDDFTGEAKPFCEVQDLFEHFADIPFNLIGGDGLLSLLQKLPIQYVSWIAVRAVALEE